MGGKGSAFSVFRCVMQGTFSANVITRSLRRNEPQEVEHLHHADLSAKLAEINRRHRPPQCVGRYSLSPPWGSNAICLRHPRGLRPWLLNFAPLGLIND